MSAPLGSFTPRPPQAQGDRIQPSMVKGRPIIVEAVALDGAKEVSGQDGNGSQLKKALTVNVWDLLGGPVAKDENDNIIMGAPNTAYVNVMWMAGAVVDDLARFLGCPPMAVKISSQKNKKGSFSYLTVAPLEGQELAYAGQAWASDPQRFEREIQMRAQQLAQTQAAGQYQQTGFQPLAQPSAPQVQHQQGAYDPNQYRQAPNAIGQQPPAPVQYAQPPMQPAAAQWQPEAVPAFQPQQFQAPAGQPGALAQIPAQVAQQYAPVDQFQQPQFQMPAELAAQYAPQQPPAQWAQPAQQAPPQYAPQQGPLPVNNSQVQGILAGLTQGQPPQQ